MYLSYDIKGIQQFIFSVPRLRYVVGASSLIAEFDELAAARAGSIFSGGGKGAFRCPDLEQAESLRDELVAEAHGRNLDLRIGISDTFSDACEQADALYPYCPEELEGRPCEVSGRWPVREDSDSKVHQGISRRSVEAKDAFKAFHVSLVESDLQKAFGTYSFSFFRTASAKEEDKQNAPLYAEAKAAEKALGSRNRWAVIAMDGNDMGRQFRDAKTRMSEAELETWVEQMSRALTRVTQSAFATALSSVAVQWAHDVGDAGLRECSVPQGDRRRAILPFRPLVLGGDDLTLLCHASYAGTFVKNMCAEFERESQSAANDHEPGYLWPATNGKLAMSAGVLYTKVTFPLHMAIQYTESLLGSAKGEYRRITPKATPAAIDFDIITDTLLDTPAARRHRELVFHDQDIDQEVRLTQRPYLLWPNGDEPSLQDLEGLKSKLAKLTNSARARILPNLRKPWAERFEYLASIAKHNPTLRELLDEDATTGSSWRPVTKDGNTVGRMTAVPDALMLLEEEHRFDNPTADGEA